MKDSNLDRSLAALNPVSEADLEGIVPGPGNDDLLEAIVLTPRSEPVRRSRLIQVVDFVRGSGFERPVFVTALAATLVAVGAGMIALSAGGPTSESAAGPVENGLAEVGEAEFVPGRTDTLRVEVGGSEGSESEEPHASSTAAESSSGEAESPPEAAESPPEAAEPISTTQSSEAANDDGPCTAEGDTWPEANAAYANTCSEPRVDCDPIGARWLCSSEQIGNDRPDSPAPGR